MKRSLHAPRVSGPVSMFTLHYNHHEIIIFGDVHYSYANMCNPCNGPTCETVMDFIRRIASEVPSVRPSLDVYIELPYVASVDHNASGRQKMLQHLRQATKGDCNSSRGSAHYFPEKTKPIIGIIGQLFKSFGPQMYNNAIKQFGNIKGVRFHYTDARYERVAFRMFPNDSQQLKSVVRNDASILKRLLHAMIFGKPFPPNYAPDVTELSSYKGKPTHKIAKQFLKLPQTTTKSALQVYLASRIDQVCLSLPRIMREPIIILEIRSVLLDAYLLCRLLEYSARSPRGTSIIYTGHAHSIEFLRFFVEYLGSPIDTCSDVSLLDTSDPNRCLSPRPCFNPSKAKKQGQSQTKGISHIADIHRWAMNSKRTLREDDC